MTIVEAEHIFNGLMLGDGSLQPSTSSSARFIMDLSDKEIPVESFVDFLGRVAVVFERFGVEMRSGYPRSFDGKNGRNPVAYLITKPSPYLGTQRRRWYPGHIKEVPEDLLVTPITLAFWFMGDGGSSRDKRPSHRKAVHLKLSSEGFCTSSIELLEQELHELGLHTSRHYQQVIKGSGIAIMVLQDSVNNFMDMVEPYMLAPYEYKVKRKPMCSRTSPIIVMCQSY